MALDQGKPPKSDDAIRSTLRSISDRNRSAAVKEQLAQPGPALSGMAADARYNVATFHSAELGRQFQACLSRAGIPAEAVMHRRQLQIMIDFEDSQRAGVLYEEFRAAHPDSPPRGMRREFDALIFGTMIGACSGSIFMIGGRFGTLEVSAPVAMGVLGALLGHLVDRLRSSFRRHGRLSFGVYEFLILATLPAAVLAVWHIITRLLA